MGTSLTELKVLRAFLDDSAGEHYGLELIERSGVKGGALYPLLVKLEERGWVSSRWEDIDESVEGRRKRRYYRLTADGAAAAVEVLRDTSRALAPPRRLLGGLGA